MKMLIFDFRESEKEFFEKNEFIDFDITFINEPLNDITQLTEEQKDETSLISVYRSSNLTSKVLNQFKNLRIIATRTYGYGHIDIDYCIEHNIAVLNVESYGEEGVAEYTIGLMIALIRNMISAIVDLKNHEIDYEKYEGRSLNNMTLGIIGCGEVGVLVSKIAHFLGMHILIYSYMQNPKAGNYCEFVDFDRLLKESDIISLHLPNSPDNYHMLSANEFDKMKDGVYIINTARGALIDIRALYDNLIKGKVKGAALDVMECEFLSTHPGEISDAIKDSKSDCVEIALVTQKLFNLDNVIMTPHIGYNTHCSINYLLEQTFNNIRDYLKGIYTNRVC